MYIVPTIDDIMSSKFTGNSKANALEFLENLEDMLSQFFDKHVMDVVIRASFSRGYRCVVIHTDVFV